MDFSWSSEQREWYDTIRTFAERKLNDTVQRRDRDHEFGAEEWRLCGEFGLLGLPVPEKYGGMGLDALTTVSVAEMSAEADAPAPVPAHTVSRMMFVPPIGE